MQGMVWSGLLCGDGDSYVCFAARSFFLSTRPSFELTKVVCRGDNSLGILRLFFIINNQRFVMSLLTFQWSLLSPFTHCSRFFPWINTDFLAIQTRVYFLFDESVVHLFRATPIWCNRTTIWVIWPECSPNEQVVDTRDLQQNIWWNRIRDKSAAATFIQEQFCD